MAASVTPLESFTHLTENLPSWLSKLDDLTAQVAEQNARFIRASQYSEHIVRRKHNSTESLRPNDNDNDVPEPPSDIAVITTQEPDNYYNPPDPPFKCLSQASRPKIASTSNAQLIQELKRKRKPGSDANSTASGRPRYRTRSMVVVYYDGEIQNAFESLVKSIATARNILRKGKVTATFKARMASMGAEVTPFSSAGGEFAMLNPKLIRSSGFSRTRLGPNMHGDSDMKMMEFDDADKDLETAQNLCEVGAHQFLRDGDCRLEITGTRSRFENVLEIATKEVEKLKLEEENGPKETEKKEEDFTAAQPKEIWPVVKVEEKMEPSPLVQNPIKQINLMGTGTIEVDDGSDAESVQIDLSAIRRTRRV